MKEITNERIQAVLGGIIADGFNRSLGALVKAGAIDTKNMMKKYKPGSEYYDLVTEQIVFTAKYGAQQIQHLLSENEDGEIARDVASSKKEP